MAKLHFIPHFGELVDVTSGLKPVSYNGLVEQFFSDHDLLDLVQFGDARTSLFGKGDSPSEGWPSLGFFIGFVIR